MANIIGQTNIAGQRLKIGSASGMEGGAGVCVCVGGGWEEGGILCKVYSQKNRGDEKIQGAVTALCEKTCFRGKTNKRLDVL